MKHLLFSIIIVLLSGFVPAQVVAAETEAGAAAILANRVPQQDERAGKLNLIFKHYNSPFSESEAEHFVAEADRLGLDWRLVAAIAGVESTFGNRVPSRSNNAWGWGVFTGTNDGVHFASWNDGITQVSEGLRTRYVDRGATTIEAIGRIYAASPRWAGNVHFFLSKIESFAPTDADLLSVTI